MKCLPDKAESIKSLSTLPLKFDTLKQFARGGEHIVYFVDVLKECVVETSDTTVVFRETIDRLNSHTKIDFVHEMNMSCSLADNDISPRIFFYGITSQGYGFDVMRKYNDVERSTVSRQDYENQIVKLLNKMAQMGIYCVDVKMDNTVVKKMGRKFDVKLIDFSSDWCYRRVYKQTDIIFFSMILLFSMITELTSPNARIRKFPGKPLLYKYIKNMDSTTKKEVFKFMKGRGDEGVEIITSYAKKFHKDLTHVSKHTSSIRRNGDPESIWEFITEQ